MDISDLRSRFERVRGYRDNLSSHLKKTEAEIKSLESEFDVLEMAVGLIRTLIDNEVTEGVQAVEKLQTEALQAVFPDQTNSVRAEIDIKRGKVNVDLVTTRTYDNGMVVEGKADEAFGGALATVQSVLLRITVILKRGLRPVLILDEALPAIEGDYVLLMARFLSLLCKRVGMDILLVTHDPLLVDAADKAYKIAQKDGTAYFKEVSK